MRTKKSGDARNVIGKSGSTESASARKIPFIVAIGTSRGGLNALPEFLETLDPESGTCFVVIPRSAPNHAVPSIDSLAGRVGVTILEVDKSYPLVAKAIYLAPPESFLELGVGSLTVTSADRIGKRSTPIDRFFSTLAEKCGRRCACIVLSGAGNDGARGLKEVKAAGGLTIVQDPESVAEDDVPGSAIATGMADLILPVRDMPGALRHFTGQGREVKERKKHDIQLKSPDHFKSILSLIHSKTGYDFSYYKKGTLDRRIRRRMSLRQTEEIGDYLEFLRKDGDEVNVLFHDLLIGVTRFFRDPEVWEYLLKGVIRPLVSSRECGGSVRVWVAGCSTGEEAYTIAILFFEEIERQKKNLKIQLFATDLDQHAVSVARAGIYSSDIGRDISEERLKNFFTVEGERFRVNKVLRESCIFAAQNIVSDPPFSNLDLVSCRNLLIYLETTIQEKLTQLFHFALDSGGVLLLGSSESTTKGEGLFDPISKSRRVFRKRKPDPSQINRYPIMPRSVSRQSMPAPKQSEAGDGVGVGTVEFVRRMLIDHCAPASILIDHEDTIHYFHGPLGPYLNTPSGQPTAKLSTHLLGSLEIKVRDLIRRAENDRLTVSAITAPIPHGGKTCEIRITVAPLEQGQHGLLHLLTFHDVEKDGTLLAEDSGGDRATVDLSEDEANLLRQLEHELKATREDLQSTIEELETSNEELKASHEEVTSMNEELQSSNEELEISREKLQSLNEELRTVNDRLSEKVDELESSGNDLSNLITSTQIATIFLDSELRIRRFTPTCQIFVNLCPGDEGRPLDDLSLRIADESLCEDARFVLEKLEFREKEVRAENGTWYYRRILPLLTSENRVNGVVITFTDIDTVKRTYRDLELRERQQAAVAGLGQIALKTRCQEELFAETTRILIGELDVGFSKILKFDRKDRRFTMISGIGWRDDLIGDGSVPAGIDSQSGYTLQVNEPVILADLAKEKRFRNSQLLKSHGIKSGMTIVIGALDDPWGVIGVHSVKNRIFSVDDVNFFRSIAHILSESTRREAVLADLEESQFRLEIAHQAADLGAYDYDVDGDRLYWDERSCDFWGVEHGAEWNYQTFIAGVHEADREILQHKVDDLFDSGGVRMFYHEFRVLNPKDGKTRWIAATARPFTRNGKVYRTVGTYQDITEKRELIEQQALWAERLEEQVIERTALAEQRADDLRQLAAQITNAEERARRKVAQIIHDDMQQLLIAAKMRLPVDSDGPVPPEELRFVEKLLDKTLQQARNLVSELSPPVLQDGEFDKALFWLATHMESTHRLKVELDLKGDLQGLEDSLGTLLFNVVRELLFNAVKHSGVGTVEVSTSVADDILEVMVEDSGKGFDIATRRKSGDGFGLFSIQERVNAFGGSMEMISAPGEGARFHVRVPILRRERHALKIEDGAIDESDPSDPVRTPTGEITRILIADDHEIVREGFARVLSTQDDLQIVAMAANGEEAIQMTLKHRPDLILMDISMPKINGIEATKEIKTRRKDIVVIGLSLHEEEVLGKAMRQAGASAYLEKDVAGSQLIRTIRRFFPKVEDDVFLLGSQPDDHSQPATEELM